MRTKMRTIYPSVFRKPEVIRELDRFREKFFSVSAGKACNNIVFVSLLLQFHFKRHWYSVQTPNLVIVLTLQRLFLNAKFVHMSIRYIPAK